MWASGADLLRGYRGGMSACYWIEPTYPVPPGGARSASLILFLNRP
jgi:hypothetical protein